MIVDITPQMLAAARQCQRQIHSTAVGVTPNYTGLHIQDRFFIGYVGEFCFRHLLARWGVKFDYHPNADGHLDSGDFFLYVNGRKGVADIKTASQSFHRFLMMPKQQLERRKSDVYIGARLVDQRRCDIVGWLKRSEVEELPTDVFHETGVVTIFADFTSLRPIESLIAKLDRVR